MKISLLVLAAFAICSPLSAQEEKVQTREAPSSEQQGAKQGSDTTEGADRIICRRTAIVGSKFKKKVCGTQSDWDRIASNGQNATAEFQRRGRGIRQGN